MAARPSLSEAAKARLLRIARETLERVTRGEDVPKVEAVEPELLEERGAFVTLRQRGELRGCIGFPEAQRPLGEIVVEATAAAATRDPRFEPVTAEELEDITIEISVLSPIEKVPDVNLIECGKHGLVVQQAQGRLVFSGLLLPQVASEHGWTREEFLAQTCLKAGLPPHAWQEDADVFWFTAEVFGEGDQGER
ncbi:MAG: AmmeMemoRadiSam system protein A [Abditibacteriales bacterium]|nr:AmmeMemoRadiSam system protein A [Abditibacteriales bacterium]